MIQLVHWFSMHTDICISEWVKMCSGGCGLKLWANNEKNRVWASESTQTGPGFEPRTSCWKFYVKSAKCGIRTLNLLLISLMFYHLSRLFDNWNSHMGLWIISRILQVHLTRKTKWSFFWREPSSNCAQLLGIIELLRQKNVPGRTRVRTPDWLFETNWEKLTTMRFEPETSWLDVLCIANWANRPLHEC